MPTACFRRLRGEATALPDSFVDAQRLTRTGRSPGDAGGGCRKYVDSSISKTINCPADLPFDSFKDVYLQAYELGCKGCTTYRPKRDHRRGGSSSGRRPRRQHRAQAELPLTAPAPPARRTSSRAGGVVYMTQPLEPAGGACPARPTKLRWPESDPRHLHHHQRHRAGRTAAPLRGVHQLEEHGALCLDGRPDADDQRGVSAAAATSPSSSRS